MTAQQQVSPKRPEAPTQASRYRPPVKVMAFAASQSILPVVQACRPSRDWKDATSWEDAWGLNERNPADESLELEWQRWVNWQDLCIFPFEVLLPLYQGGKGESGRC